MAFFIRHVPDPEASPIETQLPINPTSVDYPERRLYSTLNTKDGGIIVQRAIRDARPRTWTWTGYGPNHPSYGVLWTFLKSLDAKDRLESGLPATVEIWEDVTGSEGFARMTGSSKQWTTVKFVQVTREIVSRGVVTYETSATFYIQDAGYSDF